MELTPGTRIDRYVLLEPLGEGGQAAVWKAEDPLHPERPCALKLVELKHSRPADAERVRREARALTRLEHPSLVRCYGLFEDLRRELLGVAMELVDGKSLRNVESDPRFGPAERALLLRHLAGTLSYVHDEGVVHRDLKPDNILVSETFFDSPEQPSAVKLVDFGIAAEEGNPAPLTAENSVIGTISFLAPEVVDPSFFKAKGSTPAVDVFAFGVLAWQLMMDGPHPTGLHRASLVEYGVAYRRAAELGPDWPEQRPEGAWGELLRRCLAVVAEQRIQNGSELAAVCELAARTGAIVRPEAGPGSLPNTAPTAVASPGAMFGQTDALGAPAAPPSHAPTRQAGPVAAASLHTAAPVPSATTELPGRQPPPPSGGGRRFLVLGLLVLGIAGGGLVLWALRPWHAPPARERPAATVRALPVPPRSASASPAPPDVGEAPAASGVLVFSPTSALPENCDHDAGICACCPSGRNCGPGVCGDSLEPDQSWLLRAGPVHSQGRDLRDATVCVRIVGFGPAKCTSTSTDGGTPQRIHVDTPDLLDRGIVVEVHAAGRSARTSVLRYTQGLTREVLCSGLTVTGFEGDLQVSTARLFLDPDPAPTAAVKCPVR